MWKPEQYTFRWKKCTHGGVLSYRLVLMPQVLKSFDQLQYLYEQKLDEESLIGSLAEMIDAAKVKYLGVPPHTYPYTNFSK